MIPKPLKALIENTPGIPLYLVGGAVRDHLRGRKTRDIDVVTDRNPRNFIEAFSDYNERYQIVTIKEDGYTLEIARMRRDFGYTGRHSGIEFVSNIEDDLPRRDFTVNAIAYDLREKVYIDPFGGRGDVTDEIIRVVGDPVVRFQEDYFRILRLARFALKLSFRIDEETLGAARDLSFGLKGLNPGLLKPELLKIIRKYSPIAIVTLFSELNLLKPLFGIDAMEPPENIADERDLLFFSVLLGVYGDNSEIQNRLLELEFPKALISKLVYILSAVRFFNGGTIPPKFESNRQEMIDWAERLGFDMNEIQSRYPGLRSEILIKSDDLKSLIIDKGLSLSQLQEIRQQLTLYRMKGLIQTIDDAEMAAQQFIRERKK